MEIRQACSPKEAKRFNTDELRGNFLFERLFQEGVIQMTYSHIDRTVVGGAVPLAEPLPLVSNKQIGSPGFLDRREIGIFNIGGDATITAGDEDFDLTRTDCLYLPKGGAEVTFASADAGNPARLYFVSTPAHQRTKAKKITAKDANRIDLGTQPDANIRVLRQYIHPDVCQSCQLVMGMTMIEDGSVWNTMPCHSHDRRSEVYLYFDMAQGTRVVHLMGEPDETRHLFVDNEQAVISPGWSIHSGVGTGRYGFIWSMAGDNQDFDDMDFVAMGDLR
ncbi:5-dehydro-4-deoxy-D-glucuronate isomerase [Denitrobaculum tricleocarpae]|uniref:4-deoxy-L-threo-5-hexosulose-uronate ketol-isomerase n=1 Tax=Denitrobaculum tricleocarpae TaxID=2591009 RepID=A0A545TX35_9PROT|nr:5-dehydro-4-deoxy-D-glucuronate isomerase [Denitrobaculum tricleocarpae]TQV81785.1 5-dehydro-4-deoxy-D-glucuronate isomerase [Denitrobaculum tricleocarpae]